MRYEELYQAANLSFLTLQMDGVRDSPTPAVRSAPQLIPVTVTTEPNAVAKQPSTVAEPIEIDLAGKYRVRVSSGVDAQALRRVLDVLERQ